MKRVLSGLFLILGLIAASLTMTATPAQAVPSTDGNYPKYQHEGKYPSKSRCGSFSAVDSASGFYAGRTFTVKLYYSDNCGAFGRVDNITDDYRCKVVVNRSGDGDPSDYSGSVAEFVDKGDDFAYTQIANNLNGRLARAGVVCDGHTQAKTGWY